ncbi:MAG TPA: thioredoxin domain-containing protein [Terriglobia bacterium]|nr:thioredoxin domain-containing protein [Terriglobia bacterium]
MIRWLRYIAVIALVLFPALAWPAQNLRLKSRLNYAHNKHQGPLITGDNMLQGAVPGMPNYVIFYEEFCYNAKRMAQRTVDLYNKYKGRVNFVVIDFQYGWSDDQNKLVEKYFHRNIPQVTILDSNLKPVFDYTGEAPEDTLDGWIQYALRVSNPKPGPQVYQASSRPASPPSQKRPDR